MADKEKLNELGVKLSQYWAYQRSLEQAIKNEEEAKERLKQSFSEVNERVALIIEDTLYIVEKDGEFIKWVELPFVLTDLTVPSRL